MEHAVEGDDALSERRAQAMEVTESIRPTMVIALLLTAFMVLILFKSVPTLWLLAWAAASVAVSGARLVLARWQVAIAAERPAAALRTAMAGAVAGALVWSALPWLLGGFHVGDPQLTFTLMAMSGVAGGSLASNYGYARIPLAFASIMSVSVIASAYASHIPNFTVFSACILLFLALLSRSAIRTQSAFMRYVRMAGEQRKLTASLAAASEKIQESNRALAHLVEHDVLTGHLNRVGFRRALAGRLLAAGSLPGRRVALLLLDLDGFKALNDSLGHPAGDAALVEAARRIAGVVSALDADLVRMGGDEFAVLVPCDADGPEIEAVAERILAAIARPFEVNGERARLGCSIGVAVYPEDGGDMDSLVNHADVALYAAKERGRGRVSRFAVEMLCEAHVRRVVEDELPAAIADRRVAVHFQPQVSLTDGGLVGVEAALRWDHPLLGLIEPTDIVAIARRAGLRTALVRLVVEETARLRERLDKGNQHLRTAINVSPLDLPYLGLAEMIAAATAGSKRGAEGFEVEITEEAELDIAECGPELLRLKALGVTLALDNFGVGRSNFAVLERLEIDSLKIDRRFCRDVGGEPIGRSTVESLLALGRALDADVIAKGVETAAVAERLAELGCGSAQGYHFAPPMGLEDFVAWAERRPMIDARLRRAA